MDHQHDFVVRTIREHASALLRTARKHSLCADDAHDAYQRGLEIFLRRASSIEAATADRWLHVVIKHEALAIRRARGREVAADDAGVAGWPAGAPDDDEHVLRFDRLARSAEALARLKPQEVRALWLKAQGHSYAEIAASEGWTYTKVNRCLTEGRRSFLDRYAAIERGDECRRWEPVVNAMVDGEASAEQLAAARPHLRRCAGCRATLRELQTAGPRMAGVLPALPVAGVAAGGDGGAAGGVIDAVGRAVESVAVSLHDRVSAWAVKVQLAAEAASGAKVAAVAASAVAVAGGGAVTVAEVGEGRAAPRVERSASAGAGGAGARTTIAMPAAPVPAASAAVTVSRRGGVPTPTRTRLRARVAHADERPPTGRAATARAGGPGSREFSVEGAGGGAGAREFAARGSAPTASTASARSGPAATGAAARGTAEPVSPELGGGAAVERGAAGVPATGSAATATAVVEGAPSAPPPSRGGASSARSGGSASAGGAGDPEFDVEG